MFLDRLGCHSFGLRQGASDVLAGGQAEFPAVVAAEMGGAFVADGKGRLRDGLILFDQQAAGFDQKEVFLILEGRRSRDRPEMGVKRGGATNSY